MQVWCVFYKGLLLAIFDLESKAEKFMRIERRAQKAAKGHNPEDYYIEEWQVQ